MSIIWSGPGRALSARIELYGMVDRAWRQAHRLAGKRVNVVAIDATLVQRLKLMSSMSANGPVAVADGLVAATERDDEREAYSEFNIQRAVGTLQVEHDALTSPELHYVTEHIMTAAWTVGQMADDEMLWETDLPAPAGLLVFEHPLLLDDLHPDDGRVVPGLTMPVRAIAWATNKVWTFGDEPSDAKENTGIWYGLYADAESFKAYYTTSYERLIGHADEIIANPEQSWWLSDSTGWAFATPWQRGGVLHHRNEFGKGLIHDEVAKVRRFLLAYFRWTWSRVLVAHRHNLDRADRRRLLHAGLPPADGYIKIMRLRREAEAIERGEDPAEAMRRDHSWLVSAHPRRQHYPSLGPARLDDGSFNPASHRRIWIDSYVAGDGPLVLGHTVKAAVR